MEDGSYWRSINQIDSGQNKRVQISEEQDELLEDKNIIIYFSYNENELSDDALIKLDEITDIMNQNRDADIIIKGYTDASGFYDYNKEHSTLLRKLTKGINLASNLLRPSMRIMTILLHY
jgi:outer membrane protein OmpA-like peptidoglycan-associated protein